MFQVHENETGAKIGVPTEFLRVAQQVASAHRKVTGRHCYVTQTTMVWTTVLLLDLYPGEKTDDHL